MSTHVDETCATDPTTGTKDGDTIFVTDHLRLQEADSFSRGQFWYDADGSDFDVTSVYARHTGWAGDGTGGEGLWFFFGAATVPGEEGDNVGGYSIVANEFADQIQIRFEGTNIHTQAFANLDNETDRVFEVTVTGQNFVVEVDGVEVINYTDPTPRTIAGTLFGWASRCGGDNNEHRIKQLFVQSPIAAPPVGGVGGGMLIFL